MGDVILRVQGVEHNPEVRLDELDNAAVRHAFEDFGVGASGHVERVVVVNPAFAEPALAVVHPRRAVPEGVVPLRAIAHPGARPEDVFKAAPGEVVHAIDEDGVVGARRQCVGAPAGVVVHGDTAVGEEQASEGRKADAQLVLVDVGTPKAARIYVEDIGAWGPA